MWKWIGGILVLVLLCFVGASWYGYQTVTAGGDSVRITIAGGPTRVFAALATHDSLPAWRLVRDGATTGHHGPLAPGDTLRVDAGRTRGRGGRLTWVATDVQHDKLLAFALRNDSTGQTIATRRDSLVSLGDSTMIVSVIASPMMDSVRTSREDSPGRAGSALVDMSSKLLVSSFRMQSKLELTRLKDHIEGRPVNSSRP